MLDDVDDDLRRRELRLQRIFELMRQWNLNSCEKAQQVRRAMNRLDEVHRRVLTLKYVGAQNDQAIAGILNVSPQSVSHLIARGKELLRALMNEDEAGSQRSTQ